MKDYQKGGCLVLEQEVLYKQDNFVRRVIFMAV